jgi:hypothetical protein
MILRVHLSLFLALLVAGCDTTRETPSPEPTPAPVAPGAVAHDDQVVARVAPADPVDHRFAGCAGACGTKLPLGSVTVVSQPGASLGDHAHCPVSGAVFEITGASPKRVVGDGTVYFCCEACAKYYSEQREQVHAARGWPES